MRAHPPSGRSLLLALAALSICTRPTAASDSFPVLAAPGHAPGHSYEDGFGEWVPLGAEQVQLPPGEIRHGYLDGVPLALTDFPPCVDTEDGTWFEVPVPHEAPRNAVFEPTQNRVIVFSGSATGLWELCYEPAPTWRVVCAQGNAPRKAYGAVYDSVRHRIIYLGPNTENWYYNEVDLWILSLVGTPTWTHIDGLASVYTFSRPSLAFDPARNRAYVLSNEEYLRRTWGIDLNTDPPTVISYPTILLTIPTVEEVLISDPARNRLLLFGGVGIDALPGHSTVYFYKSEVEELPLDGPSLAWRALGASVPRPAGRTGSVVAFDAERNRLLIAGGLNNERQFGDAWALDLANDAGGSALWRMLSPDPNPMASYAYRSGYLNPLDHEFVILGGYPEDAVWSLPAEGEGVVRALVAGITRPPGFTRPAALFDAPRRRFLFHAGTADIEGMWELDLGGGALEWKMIPAEGAGPQLLQHSAVHDLASDRMVVFGGKTPASGLSNAVWATSLSSQPLWQLLAQEGEAPSPRIDHAVAYDPVGRQLLAYGGTGEGPLTQDFHDLWAFDLAGANAWSRLEPGETSPGLVGGAGGIYDSDRHRFLLLGGFFPDGVQSLDWIHSLGSDHGWSRLPNDRYPRGTYIAMWDDNRGRVVAFVSGAPRVAWELSLQDQPHWRPLNSGGARPPFFEEGAVIYDHIVDRVVGTYGGRTYVLHRGRPARTVDVDIRPGSRRDHIGPNATRLSVAVCGARDFDVHRIDVATVTLSGQKAESVGTGVPHTIVRDVNGDGIDDIQFAFPARELNITSPSRALTLRGQTEDGTWIRGRGQLNLVGSVSPTEAGQTVPAMGRLGVSCSSGNPSRGRDLLLSIMTPSAGRGHAECFDVSGRVVFRRELEDLTSGMNELRLPEADGWPTGVYFVRVRFEALVARARFVVLN